MEVTSEAVNFNLVDFYPFLRRPFDMIPHWLLPGKRKLYELQKLEDRVFFDLLYRAKARLAAGNAYPSQFMLLCAPFSFRSKLSALPHATKCSAYLAQVLYETCLRTKMMIGWTTDRSRITLPTALGLPCENLTAQAVSPLKIYAFTRS